MPTHALLIANPVARGRPGRWVARAVERLRAGGLEVEARLTARRGDAQEWAREAAARGVALVAVMGGDGTVNEAVNAIAATPTALGMIPTGACNVTAMELGIPRGVEAACDVVLRGRVETVPVGRIQLLEGPAPFGQWPSIGAGGALDETASRMTVAKESLFLMMAGAGFDADAVARVNLKWKTIIGKGAYYAAALQAFLRYRAPWITVGFDAGDTAVGRAVVVSNIRTYGGPFPMAPGGDLRQPYFNVCVFQLARRWELLRILAALPFGRHVRLPGVIFTKARSVTLMAPPGAVPIQTDGDFLGFAPAKIEIIPGALRLCTPSL